MICEVCEKEFDTKEVHSVPTKPEPLISCEECMNFVVQALVEGGNIMTDKPFIRVDYKEFEPETYWGVVVELPDDIIQVFFTEDFKTDLDNAMAKYPDHYMRSSVTQFISDAGLNESGKSE